MSVKIPCNDYLLYHETDSSLSEEYTKSLIKHLDISKSNIIAFRFLTKLLYILLTFPSRENLCKM